jgi:hypothetical protein
MRAKDGSGEVSLSSYEHFASRDALGVVMLERMLADVSTRRFVRSQEPVGPGGRGAGTLDVEVLDLAGVHRADGADAEGADESAAREDVTIPGVGDLLDLTIASEIGEDLTVRFGSEAGRLLRADTARLPVWAEDAGKLSRSGPLCQGEVRQIPLLDY